MATADDYAAWIVKNADKKGTPEFETVAQAYQLAKSGDGDTPKEQGPQRTLLQELMRQAGLGTRYVVEGAASVPGIFVDPFQKLAGAKTMTQATSDLLTKAGFPQEETDRDKFNGAVIRGMSSGLGAAGAARAIPAAIGAAPAMINNVLAQQPVAQMAQAGLGAGAGEAVRQGGGDTTAQLLASAIAPLGVAGVGATVPRVWGGMKEIGRPITNAGSRQVAADVLGEVAQDKGQAIRNIENWQRMQAANGGAVGVPGSNPTAGAVSADYGLIGGEQMAARGPANPLFAERQGANNQARLDDLARLRATPEQVAAYEGRRDTMTAPLRDGAFANAVGPVDYQPVVNRILAVAATPAGGRVESEKALTWITQRVGKYLDEGRLDPHSGYGLYQDIGDLVAGKIKDSNGSALRLAGGLANDIKRTLGAEIEKAAPGFQKYLETYARTSRPIDRLQVISDRLGGENLSRVTNALPMVGPQGPSFQLSQAKMRNAVGDIQGALPEGPRGLPLAPYQGNVLGRVMGDLNSEALATRGGKQPGSDTYQNMATANLLGAIFGKQMAQAGVSKTVTGPLNFAYAKTGAQQRIMDAINEAYLDPAKMAELLKLARTRRGSPTLESILADTNSNVYGGLLGGNAAQ